MTKKSKDKQAELNRRHLEKMTELLGTTEGSTNWRDKIRIHQGWWRAFVLGITEGEYYDTRNKSWKTICNQVFQETSSDNVNFLTDTVYKSVANTLSGRNNISAGMIDENRLKFNLLSSQPLCFNFFGELIEDLDFGTKVLQNWFPDISKLKKVLFEFAPKEKETDDNSAIDIAFEVENNKKQKGIIGLECKYTDSFSFKPQKSQIYYGDRESKGYERYSEIFKKSKDSFKNDYFDYVRDKNINQLFRNQLIAERIIQNPNLDYEFVKTGLFCFHGDKDAIESGNKIKSMLNEPENFQLITYKSFIESVQRLDLDWEKREWTMKLWVRYCALELSEKLIIKRK